MISLVRTLAARRLAGTPRGEALAVEVRRWQEHLGDVDDVTLQRVLDGWEETSWPSPQQLRQRLGGGNALPRSSPPQPGHRGIHLPGPRAEASDAARWPAIVETLAAGCTALPAAAHLERMQAIRIFIEPLRPIADAGILWLEVPVGGEAGQLWLAALTEGAPTPLEGRRYRCPVTVIQVREAAGVAVGIRGSTGA